jgi:hypothetical protein
VGDVVTSPAAAEHDRQVSDIGRSGRRSGSGRLAPYGQRMQYGAHLPLIDFDEAGWRPGTLASYVRSARRLGYGWITANDHLVFGRPWLDGIVALASVVEESATCGWR